jgi:hypothetical protein
MTELVTVVDLAAPAELHRVSSSCRFRGFCRLQKEQ